jgi:hypothetical protein
MQAVACDAHEHIFASAGALAFVNAYSGSAALPALYNPTATLLEHLLLTQGFMSPSKAVSLIAGDRKIVILRGQFWATHSSVAVGIDGPGYRPSYESSHHGDIWSHHSQHMCRFRVSIGGFS